MKESTSCFLVTWPHFLYLAVASCHSHCLSAFIMEHLWHPHSKIKENSSEMFCAAKIKYMHENQWYVGVCDVCMWGGWGEEYKSVRLNQCQDRYYCTVECFDVVSCLLAEYRKSFCPKSSKEELSGEGVWMVSKGGCFIRSWLCDIYNPLLMAWHEEWIDFILEGQTLMQRYSYSVHVLL